MAAKFIMHPATQAQLDSFLSRPGHALLLTGPTGLGKASLAVQTAEQLLQLPPGGLGNYAYKLLVNPQDGKTIGIESIRQLEHFLSLRVPSQADINRVVIITDSHLMTAEAQNALLKTLEEPPQATVLLLTASDSQLLLPTIRSRSQIIEIKRPAIDDSRAYFKAAGYATQAVDQALLMSGGLPGLTQALLEDANHPLRQAALAARQLLSQPAHERQLMVNELASDRQFCTQTLRLIQQIAELSLQNPANRSHARRWQQILEASYAASEAINANAQPKLAITNMLLQF